MAHFDEEKAENAKERKKPYSSPRKLARKQDEGHGQRERKKRLL